MAGYYGYSKSNNAKAAEREERYPLTKASKVFAEKMNCSVAKAKAFLKQQGTTEWHHTSCKYNVTDYYDVSDYEIDQDLREVFEKFDYQPPKKKEKVHYFNCWNWSKYENYHDSYRFIRDLAWKISKRDTHNTVSIKRVKKFIEKNEKKFKKSPPTHKSSLKVWLQNKEALKQLKDAIKLHEVKLFA